MYMNEALLTTGIPCGERGNPKRVIKALDAVSPHIAGIRRMGSAALDLAYVAAGRCDAYWEENVKLWDIAAGILIVKEAGGVVTDAQGGNTMLQTCSVLATNFNLHGEFLKLIK
jgi:myo-inositol-1(or 4)-monophosphatase